MVALSRPAATVVDSTSASAGLCVSSSESSDIALPSAVYDRIHSLFSMSDSAGRENRSSANSAHETVSAPVEVLCTVAVSCDPSALNSSYVDAGRITDMRSASLLATDATDYVNIVSAAGLPVVSSCESHVSNVCSAKNSAFVATVSEVSDLRSPCPDTCMNTTFSTCIARNSQQDGQSLVNVVNAADMPIVTARVANNVGGLRISSIYSLKNNSDRAASSEMKEHLQSPGQEPHLNSSSSSSSGAVNAERAGHSGKKRLRSRVAELLDSGRRKSPRRKQNVRKSDALFKKMEKTKFGNKKRRLYKENMMMEDEQSQNSCCTGESNSTPHRDREKESAKPVQNDMLSNIEAAVSSYEILQPPLTTSGAVSVTVSEASDFIHVSNNNTIKSHRNSAPVIGSEIQAARLSVNNMSHDRLSCRPRPVGSVDERSCISVERQTGNNQHGSSVVLRTDNQVDITTSVFSAAEINTLRRVDASVMSEVNEASTLASDTHSEMDAACQILQSRSQSALSQSTSESCSPSLLCGQKQTGESYCLPNVTPSCRLSALGTPFALSHACSLQCRERCRIAEESLGYCQTSGDATSHAKNHKGRLIPPEKHSAADLTSGIISDAPVTCSVVVPPVSETYNVCMSTAVAVLSGTETESKQQSSSVPSDSSGRLTLPTPKNSLMCYQPGNSSSSSSDPTNDPSSQLQPNYAVIQVTLSLTFRSTFQSARMSKILNDGLTCQIGLSRHL